jgi:hypothetical protein
LGVNYFQGNPITPLYTPKEAMYQIQENQFSFVIFKNIQQLSIQSKFYFKSLGSNSLFWIASFCTFLGCIQFTINATCKPSLDIFSPTPL